MKKNQQIKVIEYVHTADGGLARVDQLDPGKYETFRRWLGCTYLNELFRGKAEFYYPEEESHQSPVTSHQSLGDGGRQAEVSPPYGDERRETVAHWCVPLQDGDFGRCGQRPLRRKEKEYVR